LRKLRAQDTCRILIERDRYARYDAVAVAPESLKASGFTKVSFAASIASR
jgi:biopolymer transport protein ExbD